MRRFDNKSLSLKVVANEFVTKSYSFLTANKCIQHTYEQASKTSTIPLPPPLGLEFELMLPGLYAPPLLGIIFSKLRSNDTFLVLKGFLTSTYPLPIILKSFQS